MSIVDTEKMPLTAGEIYSNLDHELNQEVVEILKNKPNENCSRHAAWNFCGYIWYDGKKWKEEIWVYRCLQETLEADTVEDLIKEANLKYGSD